MKFDCTTNYFNRDYTFHFLLNFDEVDRVLHKYGQNNTSFMRCFIDSNVNTDYKIFSAIEMIRNTISSNQINLGIDYKKEYEELVNLLEPYKIDDSMRPQTTLKMILKQLE